MPQMFKCDPNSAVGARLAGTDLRTPEDLCEGTWPEIDTDCKHEESQGWCIHPWSEPSISLWTEPADRGSQVLYQTRASDIAGK